MKTRLMLIDDQALLREGLHSLLQSRDDLQVVGQASDGREAVALALELEPDVALMDIDMPVMNGIEATRLIREREGKTRVIALSMFADARSIGDMLKAGASGYVVKRYPFDELLRAIKAVAAGQMHICPTAAGALIEQERELAAFPGVSAPPPLSPRERETLQMIAEGYSTKEIAALLKLSVKTVETHRKRVMNKLHLRSVAGLTKYAISEGMISVQLANRG